MYSIGYDIGSSSIKVAIVEVDSGKKLVALHEPDGEMEILALKKDWAEQKPELWWQYICNATKRAISEANIDAKQIESIGISYQMHGLVLVDKNGIIESEMTKRILKSSISVLEAFNDVRNNKSFAHDNPVLNYNESILIFNDISNVIRFLETIEKPKIEKVAIEENWDDLPF